MTMTTPYIIESTLLFRLRTLSLSWSDNQTTNLPINYLQKLANNTSDLVSFEQLNTSELKLIFENEDSYLLNCQPFRPPS
jgi:hypothetical protein